MCKPLFMNNIDFTKTFENLEKIQRIDLNSINAYSEIKLLLSEMFIPFYIVKLKKGETIYRARKNQENKTFKIKEDVSYRRDTENITEFGRANEIGQSIFYASHFTETALFETSSFFKENKFDKEEELLTVSKWRVNEDIKLLAIINDYEITKFNNELSKLYFQYLSLQDKYKNENEKIIKFFSDQFAKNVKNNSNLYKVSCAYMNYIIENNIENPDGIIYPSVEYEFKDVNLALLLTVVDESLILESVGEFKINIKKRVIKQIGLADINEWNIKGVNT